MPSQQFQSNQVNNNVPIKGDTCFVEGFNVLPVMIDPGSTNTLVPQDAVVLTTTDGTAIFVDKATASEVPFGFILYDMQNNLFTAGQAVEIARYGTPIWAQAQGTVNRGDDLEYVPDNSGTGNAIDPKMKTSAGTNPISAVALDNASDGDIFRMLIVTQVDFVPTIVGGSINNTPIGGSTPNVAKFTTIQTVVTTLTPGSTVSVNPALGGVFAITPAQNETISAASQKAGQILVLIVNTSGTTPYTLTFSTGFTGLSEFYTGAITAKQYVLTFVSDGTNYIFQTDLSKPVVALASTATIALDTALGNTFTHTPTQAETINAATVVPGQRLTFIITTSGTSSFTLTFGTNFKSTGTLATGTVSAKVFTIEFISDGTNYNEVARSTAM